MTHQDESGRNRNERKEHDRKTRDYEADPYHPSKRGRIALVVVIVIVAIALTWLFAGGAVHT